MRKTFADFATAADAFFWLGQHVNCERECCRPRIEIKRSGPPAPSLPPELQCAEAEDEELPPVERCTYAVFDTESTGLSGEDVVLQFAMGLFDENGRLIQLYDRIWKIPANVKISRRAFEVHKIDYRRVRQDGMDTAPQLRIVLRTMRRLKERGVPVAAHNKGFDVRLLKQTALRHGVDEWDVEAGDIVCTMQRAKPHTNLVSAKTGRPKAPSNLELYQFLHDGKAPAFGALHDAATDIKVTAASFAAGRERGWW